MPWRGSSIYSSSLNTSISCDEFIRSFKENLKGFYNALSMNPVRSHSVLQASDSVWAEALDENCQIFVLSSSSAQNTKPNPLARPSKIKSQTSPPSVSGEKPRSLEILHGLMHPLLNTYQSQKNSNKKRKNGGISSTNSSKELVRAY
ncbi:MAG: hypothetical protein ACK4QL_08540 [Pseudanabaenaceae cyanobacterium]